jgi:hypothetical protein
MVFVELQTTKLGGSDPRIQHEHHQGFIPLGVATALCRPDQGIDLFFGKGLNLVRTMDRRFDHRLFFSKRIALSQIMRLTA